MTGPLVLNRWFYADDFGISTRWFFLRLYRMRKTDLRPSMGRYRHVRLFGWHLVFSTSHLIEQPVRGYEPPRDNEGVLLFPEDD